MYFDADVTTISFHEADLAQKLPSANPELLRLYEKLTIDYLEKIDRADFPTSSMTAISEKAPRSP